MGNPYPIAITSGGAVRLVGTVDFTDSGNQPGGSNPLTLLGPYNVTYQTPGVTDPLGNGVLVGPTLPVGSVIIAGWFVVTTTWTVSAGNLDGLLCILDPDGATFAEATTASPSPAPANWTAAGNNPLLFYLREAQRIGVAVYSDTGSRTFTGGAASIYALVYIPT